MKPCSGWKVTLPAATRYVPCWAIVTLSTSFLLTGSTSRNVAGTSGASGEPGRSLSRTGTTTSVSNAVETESPLAVGVTGVTVTVSVDSAVCLVVSVTR